MLKIKNIFITNSIYKIPFPKRVLENKKSVFLSNSTIKRGFCDYGNKIGKYKNT